MSARKISYVHCRRGREDAPWAAANIFADFPSSMIIRHKAELMEISQHEWLYLKQPALEALAKVNANGT